MFFFQAEDGIRDFHVTGVQTCALPISSATINGALWTLTFEIRMYLMCMAVGLVGLLARRDLLTAVVLLVLLGFLGSPTLMEVFLDGKANAVLCATAFLIGMVLCVNLVAGRRYDGAGAAGRVLRSEARR